MPLRFSRIGLIVGVSLLPLAIVSLAADEPSPVAKWEKDIQAFEAADKASPPPKGAVLFVGASSIRLWKTLADDFSNYQVINRGFGGSQIADSLNFADRIVIPYQPSVIILNAGGNDIAAGKSPEQVLASFRAFVDKVRAALPDTPIAFHSLTPSPLRWAQAEKQKQANQLIQNYIADQKGVTFIDLWNALLSPDGQPREDLHVFDRLHPNAAGYKIRKEMILKYLESQHAPTKSKTN
jgi:lysophospholipase L1-like esterase